MGDARFTELHTWIYGPVPEDFPFPAEISLRDEYKLRQQIADLQGQVDRLTQENATNVKYAQFDVAQLKSANLGLQQQVRELRDALQQGRPFVRIYQMANPKFECKGQVQDALGVHATLEKIDAALAQEQPTSPPAPAQEVKGND
jgi:predicted component of type VI protein secretion system